MGAGWCNPILIQLRSSEEELLQSRAVPTGQFHHAGIRGCPSRLSALCLLPLEELAVQIHSSTAAAGLCSLS